jgi:hypothetical protein
MSDLASINSLKQVMRAPLKRDNSGVSVNTTGGTFCNEDLRKFFEKLSGATSEELMAQKEDLKSLAGQAGTLADAVFVQAQGLISNLTNIPSILENIFFKTTGSNLLPHRVETPPYGT